MSQQPPWNQNRSVADQDASPTTPSLYIIAEIGVNHDGHVERAQQLMHAAKTAGADAIKLQIFRAETLASEDATLCGYQAAAIQQTSSQRSMLQKLELTPTELKALREDANQIDIDFIATPFGLDDLALLAHELQPTAIKMASPDLVNVPLIEAAIATELPLIISTGASNQNEIDTCVSILRTADAMKRAALLHCISAYPTPLPYARLGMIRYLASRTGLPIGFSDHTVELHTGALAVCAGARILERHLTHDRSASGPDHGMSTEPADFQRYVAQAREAAAAKAGGPRSCAPIEADVRKLARSRIIAAVDIPAGTRLTAQHLRVQRPGNGICPSQWHTVLGHTTTRPIPAGGALDWSWLDQAVTAV